MSNVTVSS